MDYNKQYIDIAINLRQIVQECMKTLYTRLSAIPTYEINDLHDIDIWIENNPKYNDYQDTLIRQNEYNYALYTESVENDLVTYDNILERLNILIKKKNIIQIVNDITSIIKLPVFTTNEYESDNLADSYFTNYLIHADKTVRSDIYLDIIQDLVDNMLNIPTEYADKTFLIDDNFADFVETNDEAYVRSCIIVQLLGISVQNSSLRFAINKNKLNIINTIIKLYICMPIDKLKQVWLDLKNKPYDYIFNCTFYGKCYRCSHININIGVIKKELNKFLFESYKEYLYIFITQSTNARYLKKVWSCLDKTDDSNILLSIKSNIFRRCIYI